jgi:hypothetical protein
VLDADLRVIQAERLADGDLEDLLKLGERPDGPRPADQVDIAVSTSRAGCHSGPGLRIEESAMLERPFSPSAGRLLRLRLGSGQDTTGPRDGRTRKGLDRV